MLNFKCLWIHYICYLTNQYSKKNGEPEHRQTERHILGGRSKRLQQMKLCTLWQLTTFSSSTKDLHGRHIKETWQSPLIQDCLILYLLCNPSYLKSTTRFGPFIPWLVFIPEVRVLISNKEQYEVLPFRRCPTSAKLKLELKFSPTKWSICLQCHSSGLLISMNTSSGLWPTKIKYKSTSLKVTQYISSLLGFLFKWQNSSFKRLQENITFSQITSGHFCSSFEQSNDSFSPRLCLWIPPKWNNF